MRIYLDNCCYNRPFDRQDQIDVYLEAQAVLKIQQQVLNGDYELIWSYVLDYENSRNPFIEKRNDISRWKDVAAYVIEEGTEEIVILSKQLISKRVRNFDALHIACAIAAKCGYFITTDYRLLNALAEENRIKVVDPVDFIEQER